MRYGSKLEPKKKKVPIFFVTKKKKEIFFLGGYKKKELKSTDMKESDTGALEAIDGSGFGRI